MLKNFYSKDLIEAGCDEAGRGCLAGSLFAAAVILPKDFYHPLLNDSKKMTEKQRYMLRDIIQNEAIAWSVKEISSVEVDRINILNASFLGMSKAVCKLSTRPELLLIDGNRFKTDLDIDYKCVIKGDGKYTSIAAASVLAKTYRDDYIVALSEKFPQYGWEKNKAYPTKLHHEAIDKYGVCEHHRLSFAGLRHLVADLPLGIITDGII